MKYTLFYIVILISLPLNGQLSIEKDTFKIKEVIISGNKFNSEASGFKKKSIDSSILVDYNNRNLADMLSENTGIFIKSYGMGGTATPSFRGTGAGHTLVAWNGINIGSPMLGQTDFSLIQVGLIDDIQIYYGGASMIINDGGLGGAINLVTKPVWNKETLISLNTGIGSFGQYSGLMKVRAGNYNLQTVTKCYFQNSENNFRYLNKEEGPEPVWQTRTDNQLRIHGFIQELYFNNKKNITSAKIWYQNSDRNLPASMLTQPNTGEKQFDESLTAMLNYDASKGRSNYSFTSAWIMNKLNYVNRLASIDSRNYSQILTAKASLENSIGVNTKLKIVLDAQSSEVKSNNYDHNTTRNTATLAVSADRNVNRYGTSILFREILDKDHFLIPDFNAGAQFRLIDGKEYYFKASISRNSKIPSMNDMYWVPGGNPDLKNEYAFIYEISYEMKQNFSGPLKLIYNVSVFRYNIKDMIQWHPGVYSYWSADNIKKVNSKGVESSLSLDYTLNNLRTGVRADYSYTIAQAGGSNIENDVSSGKQLMYIPEHQANALLSFGYKIFYSSWMFNFTGKRYITVDNSKYLPGYILNNLNTGIKLSLKSTSIDINFEVRNFFNINYQSIAYYPLPGRSYMVKILFQLVK